LPSIPMLRLAKPADVSILVSLSEQTFRDSYGDRNEPANMDAYIGSAFNRKRISAELTDPAITYLLAEVREEPVGYAKLAMQPAPPCVTGSRPIELARIYARTDWIGKGIGAALMRACLDQAQIRECRTIWLSVWEPNTHAIAFYRKWAFEDVGDRLFQLGNDFQRDVVMMRSV